MKTFYLLYKITNTINGKHYIGVHKTNDMNDSYMGSGKILKRAIKKHGIENFTKDVLAVFDTPEEMYQMESIVVDAEFVKRDDTYNIKQGGNGGWDHINSHKLWKIPTKDQLQHASLIGAERFRYLYKNDTNFNSKIRCAGRNGNIAVQLKYPAGTWKGKKHKETSKEKIGKKNEISQLGSRNSQHGTCWIYNEEGNKKIKKDDLQQYLDAGYMKGRKL